MKLWAVCSGAVTMRRSKVSVVTTGGAEEEEEKETWTPPVVAFVLATPTTRVPFLITTGLFPAPEVDPMSLATFFHRDWKPCSKVRVPSP